MKQVVILLALLISGSAYAQDYTFKVLINKGQNTVKSGNDWVPIQVGASLKAVDELRISPNGYLGLVHVSGKPLEVKSAGHHKVEDLAGQVKAGTSVLNKYTDFILSTTTDKQTNLTATGAVIRGDDEIKIFLPDAKKSIVYNDDMLLSWNRLENTSVYVVKFSSMFGDELDRRESRDTVLSVDLSTGKFKNEDNIIVEVFSKDDANIDSDEYVVKKISQADRNRLNPQFKELKGVMNDKTALSQLYLANFYEENTLLIDAITAYQSAIRMAPEVPEFKVAFQQFIARNGLGGNPIR